MHKLRTVASCIGLMLIGANAGIAQSRPDFNGTWTTPQEYAARLPLPEPNKPGLAAKSALNLRITQKDSILTISGTSITDTFALNGLETHNCANYSGKCVTSRCQARWNGGMLVLSCRHPIGTAGQSEILTTQKLSLDADGNLRVETRVVGPGFNGVMNGTYVRRTNIVFDIGA
jgi:hypothetical protein